MTNMTYAFVQGPRDAISQQVREQIEAARQQARDAAGDARTVTGPVQPTPPIAGTEAIAVQPIPFNPNDDIPPGAVDLGIAFFVTVAAILIFWPIMRALARRMDRGNIAPKVPAELSGQLAQLTQAVDAIAVEVERISEGQRFTTRLLSEQRADPARAALSPGARDRPGGG